MILSGYLIIYSEIKFFAHWILGLTLFVYQLQRRWEEEVIKTIIWKLRVQILQDICADGMDFLPFCSPCSPNTAPGRQRNPKDSMRGESEVSKRGKESTKMPPFYKWKSSSSSKVKREGLWLSGEHLFGM